MKLRISDNIAPYRKLVNLFRILIFCQGANHISRANHLQRDNPLRCALLTPLSPFEFPLSPPSAVGGRGEYSEEWSAAGEKGHLPDQKNLPLKFQIPAP